MDKQSVILNNNNDDRYAFDDYEKNASSVHDMGSLFKSIVDGSSEIEAKVLAIHKESGEIKSVHLKNAKSFLKEAKKNSSFLNLEEAFSSVDWFGTDAAPIQSTVGNDFIPLLGGPFNRQQYLNDMLKGHQQAFFALHHDPVVRASVGIFKNFVLGRGFRVDCKNKAALALWEAFEKVNDINKLIEYALIELVLYGEVLLRWLPNNQSSIEYNLPPEQVSKKVPLPRIRLADPSTCWEIITMPEDMERKLAYVFVFPTQYQMYTTELNGKPVPSSKYIYEQIPAVQIDHFKLNTVSNEKRGRGEFYPVMGYLKRLRDSVNYSIIGMQKSTAWSMDTTIQGSQQDIDNYINDMNLLGTVPAPGSEFVHSDKIKREYLSNDGASKGAQSQAFDWCFSMSCIGIGIPQQYYGGHQGGAGTRGNAIVATEPVAKKFESYQLCLERILLKISNRLFSYYEMDAQIEVTFPDIITQDRSQKLKDLALAESQQWISKERAANIAAKELSITDYDYVAEKNIMNNADLSGQGVENPLTAAPVIDPNHSITSEDRSDLRQTRGF